MPQQNVPASHGSLRGQGPSLRRGPNKISKAIPSPREEQDGRGPQALRMSDQVSTPSLGQTRASQSSTVSGSRRQPYGATSFHNPQYSISSAVSHDSTLQWRRGSALKNVMRKLFTRKRQSQLDEDEGEREQLTNIRTEKENDGTGPSRGLFAAVHNSPGANGTPSITTNKRSTGISHLSSSSSDHQVQLGQSMTLPVPRQGPRRRATLPSLVLSDEDARETAMSVVAASSPRPGSAVSREPPRSLEQRSRASTQVHRRSQSAGALRDLMRRHRMSPIQWRRRSDEMKFWPTSTLDLDHDHVPPHERPQTSATETTAATMEEDQIQPLEGRDTAPQTEPEGAPFNLGNLIQDPDVTLEQRVTTLEVKLMDLEFAIAKIQGTSDDALLGTAVDRTPQKGTVSGERHPSLSHGQPFSSVVSAPSEDSSHSSTSFAGDGRPISTGTLRPNTAYPRNQPSWQTPSSSTTNLNNISIDQYSALVTLVRREQTARRALEDQVAQLQEEMRHLRQAGHLPVSPPGTYYPIPSPDSDDARGSRRLHTTPSRKEERPVVESEAATEGNHYESRHWDSSHYRSNIETNQRNVVPGMI